MSELGFERQTPKHGISRGFGMPGTGTKHSDVHGVHPKKNDAAAACMPFFGRGAGLLIAVEDGDRVIRREHREGDTAAGVR